ncbi:MAG: single-stranded DNA-binding protein [Leptospiraceae bacterium]|nr:single-stranded DNA-binding protein [Leptospiraceae bacterium]MCK6379896.1 single-stranded DNA-binding protein [Leptospiraceae bacterium]NUM40126.1 single-stranded DNA-binding protein [Leptospiraceae bacterium]
MVNIAHIVMDGNLTADPEAKKTPNGKNVTTFSIAVNHTDPKGDKEEGEVSFFDVEAWEKDGEACASYLKKGRKVTVIGTLRQDRWKTADGLSRQKYKIVASRVRFDSAQYKEVKKAA